MDEERAIDEIVKVLTSYLQPERIILFGSRAKERGLRYADFDIAIEGSEVDIRKERLIKDVLDEKLGIYTVELVNLERVDREFKKIVLQTGRVLYDRRSKICDR
jgi:predicted nucleotidyltransferase